MTPSATLVASLVLSVSSTASPAVPPGKDVLPFIADDYPRALAQARAEGRPIFLEAWAPW
jgi:hypothetical protein